MNNNNSPLRHLPWAVLAVVGACALGVVALRRGEAINALWIVVAAVALYLVAYRYYSLFIATKVMQLDPNRATPALLNNDGLDYVPTNKHILIEPAAGQQDAQIGDDAATRTPTRERTDQPVFHSGMGGNQGLRRQHLRGRKFLQKFFERIEQRFQTTGAVDHDAGLDRAGFVAATCRSIRHELSRSLHCGIDPQERA